MEFSFPDSHFWATVGGGVEDGEDLLCAVWREVYEETGWTENDINLSQLPIFHHESEGIDCGVPTLFVDTFFVAQLKNDEVKIDRSSLTKEEQSIITSYKWWSLMEIQTTQDVIYPGILAEFFEKAVLMKESGNLFS